MTTKEKCQTCWTVGQAHSIPIGKILEKRYPHLVLRNEEGKTAALLVDPKHMGLIRFHGFLFRSSELIKKTSLPLAALWFLKTRFTATASGHQA